MEFGYKNPMTFLLQFRNKKDGGLTHELIEAGSENQAERKMRSKTSEHEAQAGIVVTNIKSNGEHGSMGNGQLPNADQDLEEVINQLQEA